MGRAVSIFSSKPSLAKIYSKADFGDKDVYLRSFNERPSFTPESVIELDLYIYLFNCEGKMLFVGEGLEEAEVYCGNKGYILQTIH